MKEREFVPIPENVRVYEKLFRMYKELHDIFGTKGYTANLYHIMKDLLDLRDAVREGRGNQLIGTSQLVSGIG